MRDFALGILTGVLTHLDLPPQLWDRQPATPCPAAAPTT